VSLNSNPLLKDHLLPAFNEIKPESIEPALDTLLARSRAYIEELLQQVEKAEDTGHFLVTTFLPSMEQWDDDLEKFWAPISHLNAVKNSDELRKVYDACLPKLTEYATELGQNKSLYSAYKQLADSEQFSQLSIASKKAIENTLRDFTLSGIALNDEKQQRFGEIKKRLAQLSTEFSNNVLDATHGWSKHITDVSELDGVPESALQSYQMAAKSKNLDGYVITLDVPSYLPVMQYGSNEKLREQMYRAYTTRASDQGPNAGQWNNSELMEEILSLRHELSQLLGYSNYAQRSLETKMASSPEQVLGFLNDLVDKSQVVAKSDFQELEIFAKNLSPKPLNAWDIPYFGEKLRLEKYAISQEELRPYFPADNVIKGMFDVVKQLFEIDIKEVNDGDCWHCDVRFFHLTCNGELIAKFYLDIFARENKRGGAWMADCRVRRKLPNGSLQLPVAFLTCNFTPPTSELPSLLTHDEVTTLFHEFGHGLHHMLTTIDCAAVSGINGVPWDAVELPSQFLENWCWEKEAIAMISGHYQTGEVLPDKMLDKMLAAKNFQSGMQMMRQLEFALFDMKMHALYDSENPRDIQALLDDVREQVAVYPVPEFNRFQHGFGHIFAGGYAAGYYSYKWAEVLSADAFSSFEEEGVFNRETGQRFLDDILQRGGSEEPMALFVNFRSREPSTDALLRHSGIVSDKGEA
jgi:oligopeptidase A